MRISFFEVARTPVLSGAVNGKVAFAELVSRARAEPAEPTALFIDFSGIDTATASYLRESVFALKSYLRGVDSNHYLVAANLNSDIWDEFSLFCRITGDAFIACRLTSIGAVEEGQLIGTLDPKQKITFDLVSEFAPVDAATLMSKFAKTEQIKGPTAWNNRLASLVAKGLIREFSNGRSKAYRPLLEDSTDGR